MPHTHTHTQPSFNGSPLPRVKGAPPQGIQNLHGRAPASLSSSIPARSMYAAKMDSHRYPEHTPGLPAAAALPHTCPASSALPSPSPMPIFIVFLLHPVPSNLVRTSCSTTPQTQSTLLRSCLMVSSLDTIYQLREHRLISGPAKPESLLERLCPRRQNYVAVEGNCVSVTYWPRGFWRVT